MIFQRIARLSAQRRISNLGLFARGLATTQQEAYLEHISSHPGISCLVLNRPQSKNAISKQLLKVGTQYEYCSI